MEKSFSEKIQEQKRKELTQILSKILVQVIKMFIIYPFLYIGVFWLLRLFMDVPQITYAMSLLHLGIAGLITGNYQWK
jgi:hypothetical protein